MRSPGLAEAGGRKGGSAGAQRHEGGPLQAAWVADRSAAFPNDLQARQAWHGQPPYGARRLGDPESERRDSSRRLRTL